MAIVASQLVANIAINGGPQSQAALQGMGASSNQAQQNLNQLQNAAKDVSSILSSKMSAELQNAQSGLQDLAVRADAAGLDVSKFASLQAQAAEASARLGVAQAQSAAAMEKANIVTADASSSTEQVALAQSKAALAAELVEKAELNAGNAMNMVSGEATRLADELDASTSKASLFNVAMVEGEARSGGFLSGIMGAAGGLLDFGSKVGMAVMGMEMIGGMMGQVITAASNTIGNFQQQLTKLVTTAGESQNNIKAVGQGMLAMTGPTATSITDLGTAMYWVESGGAHGAQGLTDLKIAAMGAKDENANLTDVAKTLMFTLNSYAGTGLTASAAMNTLIAATGQGEMTLQGLSSAISNVLPASSKLGVSLTDTTAALATMTMQGDDASSAATHLRQMLISLDAPTGPGVKALESIGLTSQEVADEMRISLPGAIQLVTDHLSKTFPAGSTAYTEALKSIAGGSKQLMGFLETSGTQLQVFKDNVTAITSAVQKGGDSIMGWSNVQQNFNFLVDQAKASVGAFGVEIGTALAPMLGSIIGSISSGVMPALNNFGQWIVNVGIPALGNLGNWAKSTFGGLVDAIGQLVVDIAKADFAEWKSALPIIEGAFALLGIVLKDVVVPALTLLFTGLDKVAQLLGSTSIAGDLARGAMLGLAAAFTIMKISDFVETIPFLVAGLLDWGAAAWVAAAGTLALSAPFLLIGAVIGAVVAGIILVFQHWGDIMDWLSNKAQQTQISVEQSHVKMAIAMDTKTAEGAQKAINNIETEKQGILQKLKETNDGFLKLQLELQYQSLTATEKGQQDKLKKADDDKKAQLAKQKELQSAMEEAQKPWIQRMGDGIQYGFEAAAHWIGVAFTDAFNWVKGIFGDIGGWFGARWRDVQNVWGGTGKWFQDRFTDAFNWIKGVFGGIGPWFRDRWNELPGPLKATLAYIGDVFQTIWNILVALWGKLGQWFNDRWSEVKAFLAPIGTWFRDRWTEAWNATTSAFGAIGKWFGDRWKDVQNIFGGIGAWFHDRWMEAWNKVVEIWTPIGKWFGDRWTDVKNIWGGIGQWFHDRGQEAWNKLTQIFGPIGQWFGDRWNEIKTNVSAKWNEIKTDTANIFHDMINGIVDHLNDGISAIEGFINYFGQGLDNIAKSLGTTGTIPVAHLGRIPHYAEGTDAHPGGFAVVGEQGRELVHLPKGAKVAPNDATEALLAMLGGKVPGYASGIGDLASQIAGWVSGGAQSLLNNVIKTLHITAPNLPGMGNISSGIFDDLKKWALSWVTSIMPKVSFGGGTGTAVNVPGSLQSWILSAMGFTGVPGSWANDLGIIAMHESGGNPNAINLTDSNAAAGHPSQGIMQTIPSTFAAYALPGHGNILNPIDNIIAGIRYIQSRYGSVFNVPGIVSLASGGGYVGYANGGVIDEPIAGTGLRTGTRYAFGEHGKELVTPYIPSGVNLAQSYHPPAAPATQSGQGRPIILMMNNREVARGMMPAITDEIRYAVNVQGM